MFSHLRSQFPFLHQTMDGHHIIYFDNAATTQKPQFVIDAMVTFYTKQNATIHRSSHALAEQATVMYEHARRQVAQFIGANSDDLIFTSGTTAGINAVAYGWALHALQKDDVILLSELEHHANILPWQYIAKKTGALIRFIPVSLEGILDEMSYPDLFDERVKLVSVTHISNALGTVVDLIPIRTFAKKVGALFLVDAAQSVPHGLVNVKDLDPDFLVFSAHKMLGPTGIGALYIKKECQDDVQPWIYGGGMVFSVEKTQTSWLKFPHKFEAGTPPIAQAIGFCAAIDFLTQHIDFKKLQEHEAHLCATFINGLQNIDQINVLGPVAQLKKRGHLVSFTCDTVHAHDLAASLSSQGVYIRAGHHCAQPLGRALGYNASIRASFYVYNTVEEVEYCIDLLHNFFKK